MKRTLIAAAAGALLLGGTTLANAHGLEDLFRLLPHSEHSAARDDHDSHLRWHREARGFSHPDEHRWERERERDEDRYQWHRDRDRDEHRHFTWRDHDRD